MCFVLLCCQSNLLWYDIMSCCYHYVFYSLLTCYLSYCLTSSDFLSSILPKSAPTPEVPINVPCTAFMRSSSPLPYSHLCFMKDAFDSQLYQAGIIFSIFFTLSFFFSPSILQIMNFSWSFHSSELWRTCYLQILEKHWINRNMN